MRTVPDLEDPFDSGVGSCLEAGPVFECFGVGVAEAVATQDQDERRRLGQEDRELPFSVGERLAEHLPARDLAVVQAQVIVAPRPIDTGSRERSAIWANCRG